MVTSKKMQNEFAALEQYPVGAVGAKDPCPLICPPY